MLPQHQVKLVVREGAGRILARYKYIGQGNAPEMQQGCAWESVKEAGDGSSSGDAAVRRVMAVAAVTRP